MTWYYTNQAGEQTGPVTDVEFNAALKSGLINPDTYVWREGFAQWMKYGEVNLQPAGDSTVAVMAACSQCGGQFPRDEMANFEGAWVCAGCKPLYVQRLREGVSTGGRATAWRSGKLVVAPLDAALPERCIKCNAPTDGKQLKRKLAWHHPAIFLLVFFGLLLYLILALALQKRTTVLISVCPEHRSARRGVILASWLLFLGGLGGVIAGIAMSSGWVGISGAAVLLFGIFYGMARGRLVHATKIDKHHVWIGGCKKAFLEGLPEWNG
jgi:GYF domain 2